MLQLETRTGSPRSFTISIAFHAIAIAMLLTIRFGPVVVQTRAWRVSLLAPVHETPHIAKIQPPKPRVFHPIAPVPRHETKIALDAPPILALPKPALPVFEAPQIAAPPSPLKTDNLIEARATPLPAPPKLVMQPAGFAASEAAPVASRTAASAVGAFESAESAPVAVSRPGMRSGGFSETAAARMEPAQRRSIASAAFGDTIVARPDTVRRPGESSSTTPIEIQFKPKPVYTPEAERLRIEGEVELEIIFEASGKLQVVRVVRGLGHGLDESAVEAARSIRFRPALSAGRAVDSTAVVHIIFKLAY